MSKNSVGRPKKWTKQKLIKLGNELIEWLNEHPTNIFFQDFLNQKGLYKHLISEQNCDEFNELIKRAKSIQEIKLIKYGTFSKLNSTMTIFVLKNHHGYTDGDKNNNDNDGDVTVTIS